MDKPKLKHNKKRNTAFLYECLVRELTKSMLEKNETKRNAVLMVLREYFSQDTALSTELKIYRSFEENSVEEKYTEKFLNEAKLKHMSINKKDLFNEQSSLINTINKKLGFSVYGNFVPNYKNLATLSQIFNDKTPIKEKVLLEETVKKHITLKEETKEQKLINNMDNLTYKTFVKKFNEQYDSKLLKEQKELLNKYVKSTTDNALELKVFLNEEIYRLKEGVNKASKMEEILQDKFMSKKVESLKDFLENFKNQEVTQESLSNIMKIQQFVYEVNIDG
jgi:hypothetical protein